MEHIIQFGITIDDDAIKKNIEEKATKQVVDSISQSTKDRLFRYNGFSYKEISILLDLPLRSVQFRGRKAKKICSSHYVM